MSKEIFLKLKPFIAEFCIFQSASFSFFMSQHIQDNHLNQNADFSRLVFQNFLKAFHHVGYRVQEITFFVEEFLSILNCLIQRSPLVSAWLLPLVSSLHEAPPTTVRRADRTLPGSQFGPSLEGQRRSSGPASHPASHCRFSAVLCRMSPSCL